MTSLVVMIGHSILNKLFMTMSTASNDFRYNFEMSNSDVDRTFFVNNFSTTYLNNQDKLNFLFYFRQLSKITKKDTDMGSY